MTVARKPLKIRTDEYDRMARGDVFDHDRPRMELLGGQLYEMAPIGTPHLVVVTRLQRLFERAIPEDWRVLVQQPLIVDQLNEPQPDVVILKEPLGRRKPRAEDCLVVIEVSDTTYDEDRAVKVPAYLRGGVPRVWIAHLRLRALEEYDRASASPVLGGRRYDSGGDQPQVAGIRVDVARLFADLPLEA